MRFKEKERSRAKTLELPYTVGEIMAKWEGNHRFHRNYHRLPFSRKLNFSTSKWKFNISMLLNEVKVEGLGEFILQI